MKDYNAYVEFAAKIGDDTDYIDGVMDRLAPYHGVIGMSPRGFAYGLVTLPATDLQQAASSATLIVSTAFGAEAVACEVMTTEEFDRRAGWADVPPLVSVEQAAEILGVSGARIRQRIADKSIQAIPVGDAGYAIVKSSLHSRPPGRPAKKRVR